MNVSRLEEEIDYYLSQHTTTGCKITHMFGVPMIAVALPLLFFSFRQGLKLFVFGWILQFIGHYVFEKNTPVILSDARNAYVPLAALIVVYDCWVKVLNGKPLKERTIAGNGSPYSI